MQIPTAEPLYNKQEEALALEDCNHILNIHAR